MLIVDRSARLTYRQQQQRSRKRYVARAELGGDEARG
jgi:hypothetical protein